MSDVATQIAWANQEVNLSRAPIIQGRTSDQSTSSDSNASKSSESQASVTPESAIPEQQYKLGTGLYEPLKEVFQSFLPIDIQPEAFSYPSSQTPPIYEEAPHHNYSTILQSLPEFEAYEYPTKAISEPEASTLNRPGSKEQVVGASVPSVSAIAPASLHSDIVDKFFKDRYGDLLSKVAEPTCASEVGFAGDLDRHVLFDLRLQFIRPLQEIFRAVEDLLRAELKVEDGYRQLAEIRKDMNESINIVMSLYSEAQFPYDGARVAVAKNSLVVKHALKKLEVDEKDLIADQRHVTLLQGEFKRQINELYGAFFEGRRLGDSQEAEEDEILYDLARPKSPTSNELKAETASITLSSSTGEGRENIDNIITKQTMDFPTASSRVATPVTIKGKTTIPIVPLELASFGSHLGGLNASASVDIYNLPTASLLEAPNILKAIRMRDLEPELSIDMEALRDSSISAERRESLPPRRRNLQQKYNEYKIARFHRRDWLAMWGSSMSQNAFSDLTRMALYDEPSEMDQRPAVYDLDALKALKGEIDEPGDTMNDTLIKVWTDTLRKLDLNTRPVTLPSYPHASPPSLEARPRGPESTALNQSSELHLLRATSNITLPQLAELSADNSYDLISPPKSTVFSRPRSRPRSLQVSEASVRVADHISNAQAHEQSTSLFAIRRRVRFRRSDSNIKDAYSPVPSSDAND